MFVWLKLTWTGKDSTVRKQLVSRHLCPFTMWQLWVPSCWWIWASETRCCNRSRWEQELFDELRPSMSATGYCDHGNSCAASRMLYDDFHRNTQNLSQVPSPGKMSVNKAPYIVSECSTVQRHWTQRRTASVISLHHTASTFQPAASSVSLCWELKFLFKQLLFKLFFFFMPTKNKNQTKKNFICFKDKV